MKLLVNILAFLLVLLIVFSAITRTQNPASIPFGNEWKKFTEWVGTFINVKKHNISMEVAPTRKPQLTYIEKEAYLRMFAPDLFGNFSEDDWQKFWAIIYKPVEDKKTGFGAKRYRTKEEIEEILVTQYPNPFSYLKQEHWNTFWQNIIGMNLQEEQNSE
jgi:hypothetical protein